MNTLGNGNYPDMPLLSTGIKLVKFYATGPATQAQSTWPRRQCDECAGTSKVVASQHLRLFWEPFRSSAA